MDKNIPTTKIEINNSSEAVWAWRNLQGFKQQKEFAEYLKVPHWVVSDWETGRRSHAVPSKYWNGRPYLLDVPITIAMKFERWRRGITMITLGALLGVSKQSINEWENMRAGWEALAHSWGIKV